MGWLKISKSPLTYKKNNMNVNTKNFDELVAAGFDGIVCLTAKNCGPCARLKPVLQALCDEELIPMVALDIEDNLPAARALGIRGAPAVISVKFGETIELAHVGEASVQVLRKKLGQLGVL